MAQQHKYIHMITELLAVIIIVPFLIYLLFKYKLKPFDKYFLLLFIIVTIIIDGYLFFTWFGTSSKTNGRKDMIKKTIRQISRWSSAAKQDGNDLIAVLHANYGAGYLYNMKELFSEKEIEEVLGSEEKRKQFESEIINIQDIATKKAVDKCPEFSGAIDFLSKMAGES